MKIVYQNVIWLLVFVAYNYNTLVDSQADLDVAGFFHKDDNQTKIAFETAISNFYVTENKIVFNPVTRMISENDTFKASEEICNVTATYEVGAVFCPPSRKTASIIESICENMEIPVIHIDGDSVSNYTHDGVIANFFPFPKLLYQGLGIIVRSLQWRSIVIFYENTASLIKLQDVLKLQSYDANIKYNSIIVIELGPGPDYRSALKQIQNKSEHRIIIDCKTEKIMDVLTQAKELSLLKRPFSYFLTSLDAHTLNLTSLHTEANITTVRIIDTEGTNIQDVVGRWQNYVSNYENRHVYLGINRYSVKTQAAIMSDAITTYLTITKNLKETTPIDSTHLYCNQNTRSTNGLNIAAFLKDSGTRSIDLLTAPIQFDRYGRRTNFNIYVVEGNREKVIAIWNPEVPDRVEFLKSEKDRNKELEERWSKGVVHVASILGEPYLMMKNVNDTILEGNDRYEGFSMELMTALALKLNITIKFDIDHTGQRGAYDKKTKSWNGLIRHILDRDAELAICDLTITPERREAVDFSTPFMRLGISILYKKPEAKPADMYAFLDPLSFGLWMYSATLYLAVTVVLFFIARLSPQDWENPHPCDPEPEELENIWHIKNCLWLTLGSIMNQGCDILPKGICSRMVASMWWFFTIIVTNSYMANLAAFLTRSKSQNEINSAEDLAQQNKVKYGTLDGGSTQSFFRDSNYPLYQRMWTNMEQSKPTVFEQSNDDGVSRVQNTKNRLYAFLMESATLEYQIQTHCDLMQVGNWLDSKSYGIAMPLDYPHRSRINEALLDLQEKGAINEIKDRWWRKKREKYLCPPDEDGGDSAKLALQNVGGVFVVLAVGVGLAYVVAIGEFLWNVRNVSVEEHMSFWKALKIELKFALDVRVTKKKVKRQASISTVGSRSGSVESRALTRSILQNAGSFLRLDVLGKGGSPKSSRNTSRHSSRPLD